MFPKIGGKPPKWMVKTMGKLIKMDDLEVPLFLETPICIYTYIYMINTLHLYISIFVRYIEIYRNHKSLTIFV